MEMPGQFSVAINTGATWRYLLEEFGKWSSVYCQQFRRWTVAGLWENILDALNHAGIAPDKLQMIDSKVIRAHHHAAGANGGWTAAGRKGNRLMAEVYDAEMQRSQPLHPRTGS